MKRRHFLAFLLGLPFVRFVFSHPLPRRSYGMSGATEPTWKTPDQVRAQEYELPTTEDGELIWTCIGKASNGK